VSGANTVAAILQVKNLVNAFDTEAGQVKAVDGVSFDVEKGRVLGIVGESGCGKSVTALSLMRLLPKPSGKSIGGEILFDGTDLLKLPVEDMLAIRGSKISMIFQEPMTALNPVHKIGKQLSETFLLHFPEMSKKEAMQRSIEILGHVGIPAPEKRVNEYPHQLSGGMRQRVVIAIALACKPDVLIADEPTTALDVTIQAQILNLMKELQKETGMAIIFITHDLGVVADMCDDVLVMYAGNAVEKGTVYEIFKNPRHPYTKGLLGSIPQLTTPQKSELYEIEGMVPDLLSLPAGCRFQNRCPYAIESCSRDIAQSDLSETHYVRCVRHEEI